MVYLVDFPIANAIYYTNFSVFFLRLLNIITIIGSFKIIALIDVLLLLYFHIKNIKDKRNLLLIGIIAQAAAAISIQILKYLYCRARPYYFFFNKYKENGFLFFCNNKDFTSFPSGHSAGVWGFIICMFFVFKDYKYIKFLSLLGVIVSLSRMLLSMHYLSDVIAGGLIGSIVVYCVMTIYINSEFKNKTAV